MLAICLALMCENEDDTAAQRLQNNSISTWYRSSLFTEYLAKLFERLYKISYGNNTIVFFSSKIYNISSLCLA